MKFKIALMALVVVSIVNIVLLYDSKHWLNLTEENDGTMLQKVFNRIYFTVMAISTIGSGYILPVTTQGRTVVMLEALFIIYLYLSNYKG